MFSCPALILLYAGLTLLAYAYACCTLV